MAGEGCAKSCGGVRCLTSKKIRMAKRLQEASSSSSDSKRQRKKILLIGNSDFDQIIEKEADFIDKTMFIKEWKEKGDEASVLLRPRRFGKSTNLSMLKSFFSLGANSNDFSRFLIANEPEFIEEHCGKYPVVFLNMQRIGGDSWEKMLESIWEELKYVVNWGCHLTKEDVENMEMGTRNLNNISVATNFLLRITACLRSKYKKRVILLIDEYDAPLNRAFKKGFYDKASSFFEEFYSKGLKGNSALENACLIGIVELRGAGLLSGLNNLRIYSSADKAFSNCFGFTKTEVSDFLEEDEERIKDVMEFYNGYYMGSSDQVINPWSFINYCSSGKLKSYWTRSADDDALHSFIGPVLSVKLIEVLSKLWHLEPNSENQGHRINELSTTVNYSWKHNIDSILCFLVHAGYLTYKDGRIFMPNNEIKYEWKNCNFGATKFEALDSRLYPKLISCFRADVFDIASLQRLMREALRRSSNFDTIPENSYHMLYLGLFAVVSNQLAVSNPKGDHGSYDIGIIFQDIKRVFLFELKHSKAVHDLEKDAESALARVHENKYYEKYHGWTCIAIGVSFVERYTSLLHHDVIEVQ